MSITLLSKPQCVQCDATKRWLKKHSAPAIEEINIMEHPDLIEEYKSKGLMSAPVVLIRDAMGDIIDFWAGYRPDRLKAHLAA